MRWLLVIGILLVLFGPLRRWARRHWALLLSVLAGAVSGFVLGILTIAATGARSLCPGLPVVWALLWAIAFAKGGPAWLRHMEKDGKDEPSSR